MFANLCYVTSNRLLLHVTQRFNLGYLGSQNKIFFHQKRVACGRIKSQYVVALKRAVCGVRVSTEREVVGQVRGSAG